jgi:hypothetical protein
MVMKITDSATPSVIRGPQSWTYIYVALGFALAIEGTIIQMIDPLRFPYNLVAYLALAAATGWLFLASGWFQNKLIGMKNWYESQGR